jgi:DNA-directed RNA polymerase subunit H (RpoH/RPB5)
MENNIETEFKEILLEILDVFQPMLDRIRQRDPVNTSMNLPSP